MSEPFYIFIGFFYVAMCTFYSSIALSILLYNTLKKRILNAEAKIQTIN
jgi:hypothetical protein